MNLKSAIHNPQSAISTPLTFKPIFIERMWGGRRLESEFCKELPPNSTIGESWEIVDRAEAQSIVRNGPLQGMTLHQLWTQHRDDVFGTVPATSRFPLLIKILDANKKLSLQVHPPENVASRVGGEAKTEFWYVAAADTNAEVFAGFREPITRDRFEQTLRDGTVIDCVRKVSVQTGNALFLPAGCVHAAGAGNLLIEIQQNSDTTFRLFDWNRTDPKSGKERELHLEQAVQCIDFKDVRPKLLESKGELLVRHELFEVQKWNLNAAREAGPLGRFAIVCCLSGSLQCSDTEISRGEFMLVPAGLRERKLRPLAPQTSLLRVTIPV